VDFGILLGQAYQAFVQSLHAQLADRGFTVLGASYGYVLRALAEDSLTASQLGEQLGITAQGAAKVVEEMVGHGLVERRQDPTDKRAKRLHLSASGRETIRSVREFHAEFEQQLIERMGADNVATVRSVLDGIIDAAHLPDHAKSFRPL
jgi:DNA-binding MarR family transcriptional regulator